MAAKKNAQDQIIKEAYQDLSRRDQKTAIYLAERSVALTPDRAEPWMILALLSSPRESVSFMKEALQIDPKSPRVQAGMRWAMNRLREQADSNSEFVPLEPAFLSSFGSPASLKRIKKYGFLFTTLIVAACFVALGTVWQARAETTAEMQGSAAEEAGPMGASGETWLNELATASPTPFLPVSPTPSPTETPTQTPTNTPTQEPTATATKPPKQPVYIPPAVVAPSNPMPSSGAKSIVISLSKQRMYAYQGEAQVYSFIVSTGRYNGTRQGNFRILDKVSNAYSAPWGFWMPYWMGIYYASPDMENGIHALPVLSSGQTIWGNALGTPISYGCIVLGSGDARLLFTWANIGTTVSIRG
jgi:lipoprotein-anchoring transpeptidase ErfK/SrfK